MFGRLLTNRADRRPRAGEEGFTVIEVMVALLVLAVVMAGLAPAFYGGMKLMASSAQRSAATQLAVAANEQLRSMPYWEVGYNTTPAACTGSNPVVFNPALASPPVPTLPASQPVGGTNYGIVRCLYWVDASDGSSLAYKQSQVTVSWSDHAGSHQVQETSALYPGGEAGYTGQRAEYPPSNVVPAGGTTPPSPPATAASVDDTASPTNTIDVSWTAPALTPTFIDHYIVEYNTTGTFTSNPVNYTSSPPVYGLQWDPATFAPGTTYYFQVVSVAADGTTSTTATSAGQASTTASSGSGCTVGPLTVNPPTATVDNSGKWMGSFTLNVSATSDCGTVTVAYTTTSSTLQFAAMTGVGNLQGSATSNNNKWSVGNHVFTVYVNGTQWTPLSQSQVDICQQNNNTLSC